MTVLLRLFVRPSPRHSGGRAPKIYLKPITSSAAPTTTAAPPASCASWRPPAARPIRMPNAIPIACSTAVATTKPKAKKQAGRGRRHLRPVRMAVEDREEADQRHGDQRRDADRKCDRGAQRQHRKRNAGLHVRNGDAEHAGDTGRGHHGDEGAGDEPQRAAAELGGEHADRQHGDEVVEPGEWMRKPVRQVMDFAKPWMGGSDGRMSR